MREAGRQAGGALRIAWLAGGWLAGWLAKEAGFLTIQMPQPSPVRSPPCSIEYNVSYVYHSLYAYFRCLPAP